MIKELKEKYEADMLQEIVDNNETMDESQFIGAYKGHQFRVLRHPDLKHLCGYVQYNEFKLPLDKINEVNCHGGITFKGQLTIDEGATYIGFDCAHLNDRTVISSGDYKNLKYVIEECMNIIDQITGAV
jgi:hypothetical protein